MYNLRSTVHDTCNMSLCLCLCKTFRALQGRIHTYITYMYIKTYIHTCMIDSWPRLHMTEAGQSRVSYGHAHFVDNDLMVQFARDY